MLEEGDQKNSSARRSQELLQGPSAAYAYRGAGSGSGAAGGCRCQHAGQRVVSVRRYLRHRLLRYGHSDGFQGAGESGIQGASVTIFYIVDGTPYEFTVATDENGLYSFGTGTARRYTISAQIPPETTVSPADQGGDDARRQRRNSRRQWQQRRESDVGRGRIPRLRHRLRIHQFIGDESWHRYARILEEPP